MNRLSELAVNKNNNFNLIRLAAAIAVLAGHCFPLATGREADFWIGHHLGISLGSVAVDIFFITSGFLVTGSLLSSKDTIKFIKARILRVYPALLVMLIFTTIFIGAYFTKLQTTDYFTNHDTYWYFLKNASLITGVSFTLPGVFETNPFKIAVNGSLWTLPYEIWMYSALALIWLALGISTTLRLRIFKVTIVIIALLSLMLYNSIDFSDSRYFQLIKLFAMFFSGAACFVLQKQIILSLPLFFITSIALLVSILNKDVFHVAYSLALSYLLICVAYMPSGRIRAFNRIGDYSYGIYIYAFPVQQSMAAIFPNISVGEMLTTSLLFTFALAALSWHLIEKPSLALKTRASG